MRFSYTYKTSDGMRHEGEISAPGRDAAFTALRKQGIRPIRVMVQGNGRMLFWRCVVVLVSLAVVGLGAWWIGRRGAGEDVAAMTDAVRRAEADKTTVLGRAEGQPATKDTAAAVEFAKPLERQMIPGNRERIEDAKTREDVFRFSAEKWLARFAEPGRISIEMDCGKIGTRPSKTDFAVCLKEPIRIASTDFTEVVDLKRIVTGMKREMNAYLAGGGTVEGYLAELEKRQKLEVSYRERAEQKLTDMLNGQDARSPGGRDSLKAAYAYWLKANAQLQAMGIYPLALPDVLRSYQMSLDIDE